VGITIPVLVVVSIIIGLAIYFSYNINNINNILTPKEKQLLLESGNFKDIKLLYRASRDGFSASNFHA
jgi:hypothetical protein